MRKCSIEHKQSGFGAVGSAHVWGARGRWFESSNPDIKDERSLSNSLRLSFFLRLLTTYHARFPLFFVLNLEKSHSQGKNGTLLQIKK